MTTRQTARKRPTDIGSPIAIGSAAGADRAVAARLSELLARRRSQGVSVTSSDGQSVDLPPSLVAVLETAAGMLASGVEVSLLATDTVLSSQQAADILNVSRQYMVRLLDRGDLPSTKIGTHRRVKAADLAAYRQGRDEGRRAFLDELAAQAQASGGYDEPAQFGPRRPR
jgi:excisionase family DNA binding protein